MINYKLLSGNTLAYIGDAIWSVVIRKYLIEKGITKADQLQKLSIKYVSAKSQASIYYKLQELNILDEKEIEIFKRGRNSKSNTIPKNSDPITYSISTGFEALIGYLYLDNKQERIMELFNSIKE